MMFDLPHDPVFPALSALGPDDLHRITGATPVDVLRFRHQPGMRAVLHVALGTGGRRREGVIWFLWPEKIDRLRALHPSLRVDAASGAVFEHFPTDHRVPELARFMADRTAIARTLFGADPTTEPTLLRYRPGLSATFRWAGLGLRTHFVKVARKARVAEQAAIVSALVHQLEGSALTVAPVSGHSPDHCLIAYHAAEGRPFDDLIREAPPEAAARLTRRVLSALGELSATRMEGLPPLFMSDYLRRAARCAEIISTADAEAGRIAGLILEKAERARPSLRHLPIHADMKLDHAFLTESRVTLIDTESLHLGDPDHDLALLDARLDLSLIDGTLDAARIATLRQGLQGAGGPDYGWFLSLGRLHAAKFIAQRLHPDRSALLHRILAP